MIAGCVTLAGFRSNALYPHPAAQSLRIHAALGSGTRKASEFGQKATGADANSTGCLDETANKLTPPKPASRVIIEEEPTEIEASDQCRERHWITLIPHVPVEPEIRSPAVPFASAAIYSVGIVVQLAASVAIVFLRIEQIAVVA